MKISTAVLTLVGVSVTPTTFLALSARSGFSSEEISVGSLNKHRRTLGRLAGQVMPDDGSFRDRKF